MSVSASNWDTARPWVEALIAAVQDQDRPKILRCIEQLKAIFDGTNAISH